MGISSSQIRLLFITGRKHNIELKSQRLQSEKLTLATQEDQAYEKYCDALETSKLQVSLTGITGNDKFVDANFTTVCKYNPDRIKQYQLFDNKTGKIIVPQNVADNYEKYDNDKYIFAWAMLGFTNFSTDYANVINRGHWAEDGPMGHLGKDGIEYEVGETENWTMFENMVFAYINGAENGEGGSINYANIVNLFNELNTLADKNAPESEIRKKREELRDALYEECAELIFKLMNSNAYAGMTEDCWLTNGNDALFDLADKSQINEGMTWTSIEGEFEYYVNLWESINEAGGCQVIDSNYESGEDGNNWFKGMLDAGLITLKELQGGLCGGWKEVNIATSIGDNYFQEVEDEAAIKRAQVEYEHTLSVIDRKDQKFDLALKKLETEEKALNTQEEGLKQLIQQNIEKSFKLDA